MKKKNSPFNFSDLYTPLCEIDGGLTFRRFIQVFIIIIYMLLVVALINDCSYASNFFPYILYFYVIPFLIVHLICFYTKKHIPYFFYDSPMFGQFVLRTVIPMTVIVVPLFSTNYTLHASDNIDLCYSLIVSVVFYTFLNKSYQRGFFSKLTYQGALRYPEIAVNQEGFNKIKISSAGHGDETLFYTEVVILIFALLLPLQDYISFDIKRMSFLLFSLNIFTLFFWFKSIRDIVRNIFIRLSKALIIFVALASFTFVLATQLKNVYFNVYPVYFSDIATSLKTVILIISGELLANIPTSDTELLIISIAVYSFLGIILLSFFTAFLVDSNKSFKTKRLIGRINFKNTYVTIVSDYTTGREVPYEVQYDGKTYRCSKSDVEWYLTWWDSHIDNVKIVGEIDASKEGLWYNISDAFYLIGSYEVIKDEEEIQKAIKDGTYDEWWNSKLVKGLICTDPN